MKLTGLNGLFSAVQPYLESSILSEFLQGDKQNKEKIFKDLFGKDYEAKVISIGVEAYDKPIRIAIGIPKMKNDLAGAESCDSSSDPDYDLFKAEMRMFEKAALQLAKEYPDEFVAVQNGRVLDHDRDEITLTKRVYSRYPHGFVLIRHTQQTNIPTEVWLESPE